MTNRFPVTLVGNVVRDPEAIGNGGMKFPLAVDTRGKDASGNWVIKDTIFYDVVTWNQRLADAVQLQVAKGNLLTVTGDLTLRSYEAKDGSRRTGISVDATSISRDIRLAHETNESVTHQNEHRGEARREVDSSREHDSTPATAETQHAPVPLPPAQAASGPQYPATARAAAQEL